MRKLEKLEKHYIKKIVQEILEIEKEALITDPFDNGYAAECYADEIYDDINYYIVEAEERGVNKSVIDRLENFNYALWRRNIRLYANWY